MPLAITNVTLIDGTGAAPVEGATVVIDDGRFVAAGRDVQPLDGAEAIDGTDLWATPGLIDTHVHLALTGEETLPLYLGLGVTTIRDLGDPLDFVTNARRSLEGGAEGPRLLFTGPMIDGDPPTWPALPTPTQDPEGAARAVDECLAAGADAIKLYTTLPPESLRRAIEQVARRVPVTGHLGRTLASQAMEAGIDGLEHALLTPYNDLAPEDLRTVEGEIMMSPTFWPKVLQGWLRADLDSDGARRWIDLVVQRDVSFCPTLTVVPGAALPPEEEQAFVEALARRREERGGLQGQTAQRRPAAATPSPEQQELARNVRAKLQDLVRRVHEAGGRVVSGTDTGVMQHVPGFALHHELSYLAEGGLSNMDVLRASTARAAEALWRDDLGTVEASKRADLLLLRSDPLADVAALRDIEHVIHDGKVYDPDALMAQARAANG